MILDDQHVSVMHRLPAESEKIVVMTTAIDWTCWHKQLKEPKLLFLHHW